MQVVRVGFIDLGFWKSWYACEEHGVYTLIHPPYASTILVVGFRI